MERQARRDTHPERALRSELHRRGLRFRLHRRLLPGIRREADIVFASSRVAVFVDGCFWHGCPDHATWPKQNAEWWRHKIVSNKTRDRTTDEALRHEGWEVIRIWEHEPAQEAADRVERVLADNGFPTRGGKSV
jgi:DNA mismatch endonuclease (patch repair protein)